ncbi:Transposon Ty3-G Gag-Pol polyprotein [Thelohanellus kitauei]|uniref:Transposon Ty3-G Gag-Pol polyprotein n=1 Tax=Thelohanellus kitauei TaxID=669202 RepID=A0A0C2MLS5_THEKT|nr:Transposon Ty3-G Gag-Pol polyprotein [Thelohanellus kitauei]
MPDFSKPFILDVDASNYSIRAVLSQTINRQEKVIAYANRTLTSAECNYYTTRKEMLELVWGASHFRPYLLPNHFVIRSDHHSLNWLNKFKDSTGQMARWIEKLQEFDFTVEYRSGEKHTNADGLSRIVHPNSGKENKSIKESNSIDLSFDKLREISSAQKTDIYIHQVIQWIRNNSFPQKQPKNEKLSPWWKIRHQLVLIDDTLYRKSEVGNPVHILVIPFENKSEILAELHDGIDNCHLGIQKTLDKMYPRYFWFGMRSDVMKWIESCTICQSSKKSSHGFRAPMNIEPSNYPMERIAMDILGPLPVTNRGNRYILVVGDYFTKCPEAYAIPNMEAKTVANVLFKEFICRFGAPKTNDTDQGKNFDGNLIKELCFLLRIKKTRTTPYRPQSDGLVERFNRTLIQLLRTMINGGTENKWDDYIPPLLLAYRQSKQSSTTYSPYNLMFGRDSVLVNDLIYNNEPKQMLRSEYIKNLKYRMRKTETIVKNCQLKASLRQKANYDQSIHIKEYKIGDKLWVVNTPKLEKCKKLQQVWVGPYQVVDKISPFLYKINDVDSEGKLKTIHIDRAKPFVERQNHPKLEDVDDRPMLHMRDTRHSNTIQEDENEGNSHGREETKKAHETFWGSNML